MSLSDDEIYAAMEEGRRLHYRLQHGGPRGQMMTPEDDPIYCIARAVERAAVAAEREACALIAEREGYLVGSGEMAQGYGAAADAIADAIRARAKE